MPSGHILTAENPYPTYLLFETVFIPFEDFTVRIIRQSTDYCYFVTPTNQIRRNLIDLKLLGIEILRDNYYFQYPMINRIPLLLRNGTLSTNQHATSGKMIPPANIPATTIEKWRFNLLTKTNFTIY
jgi:hypothetical protein